MLTCDLYIYTKREAFAQITLPALPHRDDQIAFYPEGSDTPIFLIIYTVQFSSRSSAIRLDVGLARSSDRQRFEALLNGL